MFTKELEDVIKNLKNAKQKMEYEYNLFFQNGNNFSEDAKNILKNNIVRISEDIQMYEIILKRTNGYVDEITFINCMNNIH